MTKRRRPIWTDDDRRAEAAEVYDAINVIKRHAAIDHLARALTLARLAGSNAAIVGMRLKARETARTSKPRTTQKRKTR